MSELHENTLTAYLGPEFQQRLMWQLLVEPEFAEKTISILSIEYFDDPNYKRLFIIMLEYFKEYEKVPNLQNQSIYQAIAKYGSPNNIIEQESSYSLIKRIELWNERVINKEMLYDGDIVQKETNHFIRQQEIRKLGEYIIDKTKSGGLRDKNIFNLFQEKVRKISEIGEEGDRSEGIFENIDRTLRKEFREPIPTGIGALDILTDGGLGKGEFAIVLMPSGTGKTTFLTKIANTAYMNGKNVLQIIIEDTNDQVKRKHYAIFSKTGLSKMDDDLENVKAIIHSKAKNLQGVGRLIIQPFSEDGTTMPDIRNWMVGYQKKYGFKFDILILDYLDCIESHKKTFDGNGAEIVVIKAFGALAKDFQIPCWTASQSNRLGYGAEYLNASQTGGSIKKYEKAHLFMTVTKNDDQKEANLANISIEKARFVKDGQKFPDSIFNNDTMEIRIEDPRYPTIEIPINNTDMPEINGTLDNLKSAYEALTKREEVLVNKLNDNSFGIDNEIVDMYSSNKIGINPATYDEIFESYNIPINNSDVNNIIENSSQNNVVDIIENSSQDNVPNIDLDLFDDPDGDDSLSDDILKKARENQNNIIKK